MPIVPSDVKQGIVLELPAVVNTLPELSEEYRGKISWVEVRKTIAAAYNAAGYAPYITGHSYFSSCSHAQIAAP